MMTSRKQEAVSDQRSAGSGHRSAVSRKRSAISLHGQHGIAHHALEGTHSVAFGEVPDGSNWKGWVNAAETGVEVGPGRCRSGEESRRGLVERATRWPGPGRSRGDEVIHDERELNARAHAKAQGRTKVSTCISFAAWRELFRPGVRHSSHPWVKGSRKGKNVHFAVGLA